MTGKGMAFALAVLMLIGLAHPAAGQSAVQLKDVQVEQQNDSVTVKLWTTGIPSYSASLIDTPTRLVIDLTGTAYAWDKSRVNPDVAPIREIRGSQWKVGTARIVLELTRKVGYRIEPSAEGLSVVLEPSASAASDDAPKATASKPTPKTVAKAEVAKAETPKSDGAKPEMAKVEAPKTDARKDIVRVDAPKAEPAKKDVARAETPQAEPTKVEPVKKDVVRVETPKAEPTKAEPVKKDVARAETPKAEPTKAEAPKAVVKAEVPKVEAAKADASKADARVEAAPVVPPPPAIVAQATVTPAPPPANGGRLLSMDFKDADVINLLRILAAESGKNIVAGDDVKGKVSVSLRNVTWEQALDTILEVKGLQKIEKGNVIRIVSTEQLTKEREAEARVNEAKLKAEIDTRTKLAEAQIREQDLAARKIANEAAAEEARSRGPLREETVRLSYADPEEVAKTLQGILGIPPEGTQPVSGTIPSVPPVISSTAPNLALPNQPPFSALYGPGQPPTAAVSISQDVLAKGITIRSHKPTNTIFIRHYQADLERIKKLIREQLDIPLPQVKIEARMEILDRTALEAIGVQWGGAAAGNTKNTTLVGQGFQSAPSAVPGMTLPAVGGVLQPDGSTVVTAPTGVQGVQPRNTDLTLSRLLPVDRLTGLPIGGNLVNIPFQSLPNASQFTPAGGIAFGIVGTNFNINLALQALENQGKTRTLARPEIVTVENNKAEVSLGEEIPYATVSSAGTQIQFKEAVLKLTVTPTVTREKINSEEITKIKMVVIVENNSRGDTITPAAGVSVPIINRRKAETQVLMREGERLVIGGVTQSVQQNTVRKVPLFGDIPLLGWLFKARETFESGRELVVFLTPSLVKTDGTLAARPASGK
ncbi:MAG TPA: secretin and TonB N-terminal domain-containing protein [Pseudomonadales bacterium]|nr:secretin and TonB N-terminal domain-containing protein [Pseudomonadales bacterium]